MNTELDIRVQTDLLQTLKEKEVTPDKFLAVRQAGVRMLRIFGMPHEEGALTNFFDFHAKDIAFDCQSFQGIEVTNQQVGLIIQTIDSLASSSRFPGEFHELFVRRMWKKDIAPNASDSTAHVVNRLANIPFYIAKQFSLDVLPETGEGSLPQDHLRILGQEEQGYDEVEDASDDAGVRQIQEAINSLPDEEAKTIIVSLVVYGEEETETTYGREKIEHARNLLHNVLYGEEMPKEVVENRPNRRGHILPPQIKESRKELADIVRNIGLQEFFIRIRKANLPYEELTTLLYYMGYFHSDEIHQIFTANEGMDPRALRKYVAGAIRIIKENSASEIPIISIQEIAKGVEKESVARRNGKDRFLLSRNPNQLVEVVSTMLTAFPDRLVRIKSEIQREVVAMLLQLYPRVPSFSELSKVFQPTRKIANLHTELVRIVERLIPDQYLVGEKGKLFTGSFAEEIIHFQPLPEVLVLINSDPRLALLYSFMVTPNKDGIYPDITVAEKQLKITRHLGTVLVGVLRKDINMVLEAGGSQKIALKILALKLGAPREMFADASKNGEDKLQEFIRKSLAEKIANDFPITNMKRLSQELDCPRDFLFYIVKKTHPFSEVLAIIHSDPRLNLLYSFLTTPNEQGRYPGITEAVASLGIDKGMLGVLRGVLRQDLERVLYKRGWKKLGLKILALKLGARVELFNSSAHREETQTESEPWEKFLMDSLREKIRDDTSSEHIDRIAQELGCPEGFLFDLVKKLGISQDFKYSELPIGEEETYHKIEEFVQFYYSPEVLAIIHSDPRLNLLYSFLTTPNEQGRYPGITEAQIQLNTTMRMGIILLSTLRQDIGMVLDAGGSGRLGAKLLALKLGASQEVLSGENDQFIQFIKSRLDVLLGADLTQEHTEKIAKEIGCPPIFLCQVICTIRAISLPVWAKMMHKRLKSGRNLSRLKNLL